MRIWIGVIVLAVIAWVAWPYYAVNDLVTAVRDGDVARLEQRVDWPAVKAGVREDLSAMAIRRGDNPGVVLGPRLIDSIIDSMVTPQRVVELLRGERGLGQGEPTGGRFGTVDWGRVNWAFFSGGPTSFLVDVNTRDSSGGDSLKLLFRWEGDWKLHRLVLPPDLLQ
ncbi:DUF2939 domain-containing protein [Chelatococcus sp. GCM10030263]|uniref:DUF2939 domain-containing protein n=1 Tax=Chelatococcus sp. GCM10030263 TaxID=3273387 RepID=UPI00361A2C88